MTVDGGSRWFNVGSRSRFKVKPLKNQQGSRWFKVNVTYFILLFINIIKN